MKTTQILHKAILKNNCPICYNDDGLEISFSQDQKQYKYFTKTEKEIKENIYCNNCKQNIYPVHWTKDIELVYDYHKKLATPLKSGFRRKKSSLFS